MMIYFLCLMFIIVGFGGAYYIFLWSVLLTYWLHHKWTLIWIAIRLLRSKNPDIRKVGWDTIRLLLWETKENKK